MYLGIDIGTSGVKAVLVEESGKLSAQAVAPLMVSRPHALWSEQSAEDWWHAAGQAVLGLPAPLRAAVRGIGLAGQMHGATLLGRDDRPIRPAILWNDGRSFEQCTAIEAREPGSRAITGNIMMPGFTAPKLAWVRDHEPEIFAKTCCVLLPKDYVRLKMTGDKASDMSDAAGTMWLDVAARDWSDAMLAATELSREQMPHLYEGVEITGSLRAEVAAAWGMNRVPVVAGAGDNAAGAVGVGVVADGNAMLSLGTSGVIFVTTGQFRPNPDRAVHAFCHCLPGLWHQMSVHLSAASCIDWAARFLGLGGPADLFALAEQAGPAIGDLVFLPYLSGERTPHNDPHARGAFLGMDHDTDASRLAAAVLEGVAFAHADGLAALREAGTRIDALSMIGGGARSRYWGTVFAAALGIPLEYLDGGEVGPALGAARLAQLAGGVDPALALARPAVLATIQPDDVLAERLAPRIDRFRRAYAALRTL